MRCRRGKDDKKDERGKNESEDLYSNQIFNPQRNYWVEETKHRNLETMRIRLRIGFIIVA